MTPFREAILLPLLFLSVTLLGGLRIAAAVRLEPPPLSAVVLALLLVAALARSGALASGRLMHARRAPMENLSGAIVLLTLFAASSQVFNLVTPDRGLLHVLFTVFFFVQLLGLLAARTDRDGLLRSLLVLLGSAFLLRYLALEALYAPDSGMLKRVLTAMMEGVTLGAVEYLPHSPLTGYVALATLILYMIGLVLLPTARRQVDETGRGQTLAEGPPANRALPLAIAIAVACAGTPACSRSSPPSAAVAGTEAMGDTPRMREDALRAARVWHQPRVPIGSADLSHNPPGPGAFQETDDVDCRFRLDKVGGTTPKFYCELAGGEVVKVKYGAANAELHAEVAATRLLAALGFSVDRMYVVQKVRCAGCPPFPFKALRCMARIGMERACFTGGLDYGNVTEFRSAVIERRLDGRKIEALPDQGWAWYELERVDRSRGGSSRAELDALRLVAMLLAHWDNKGANQRLVCPPGADRPDGSCAAPVAVVQDLGATFGPTKLDLHNWRATPIWSDAASCAVSMKRLPFHGATFPDHRITEQGRQMALGLLEQLSTHQLRELFTASGVTSYDAVDAEARDANAWVSTFQDKVRQIRGTGPCPAAAALTTPSG